VKRERDEENAVLVGSDKVIKGEPKAKISLVNPPAARGSQGQKGNWGSGTETEVFSVSKDKVNDSDVSYLETCAGMELRW
jgi:hypothetical protein